MKQSAIKMAVLGQFLWVPRNFEISRIGWDQVQGTTLPFKLFNDFSYRYELQWSDAQCNEAVCYLKWPCSANFWEFHGTAKFSMIGFGQEDDIEEIT